MTEQETRTRYAIIAVKVPVAWLTADGDNTEEEGWEYLEMDLKSSLSTFLGHLARNPKYPKASFEEWAYEEVPA